MKTVRCRVLGIILLFLYALMPLSAKAELDMMIGNDNLTFGLAKNNDDGKSFGSTIDFGFDRHNVNASLVGVTVKGYQTDKGPVRGRYDSFNLGYSYLFDWTFDGDIVSLQPYGGFNLVGNLGMEWVQNTVHGVLGKKAVHLPYDFERIEFLPTIGLEAGWRHRINDDFSLGLFDRFSYRIHFGISNDIVFQLLFDDKLDFKFGYAFEKNLTGDNNTYEVQAIRDNGFIFASSVHAGIFALEFRTNLSLRNSYGLMGLNPLAFMDMDSFDDTGRSFSIGLEYGYPGYMHRLILSDHNWLFRCKYVGGEIEVGSEKRINNASFSLGYDFIWEMGHFSPFVAPWAGLAQYIYFRQNWSTNKPDMMIEAYRPAVGCDVGVRMIRKGTVCLGGSSFSVDAGVSLGWNMLAETIDASSYGEYQKKVSPIEARGFIDLVFHI